MQKTTVKACHRCYGTDSMLVIKINIVLRTNTNISSSADRREDTGDLKTLPEFYQ